MPIDVRLGDDIVRVPMEQGVGVLVVPNGVDPIVDPGMWVLMDYDGDNR